MREYSEDLKFKAIDSTTGSHDLLDSTLSLVNNSGLPDERVRKEVSNFLEKITIDFHSNDPDVPELHSVYETEDGENYCSIYGPNDGRIKSVSIKSGAEVYDCGKKSGWETFYHGDTGYSIRVE